MKMTKKIMLAAVAMAAVMLSSCAIGDVKFTTGTSGDGTRNYKVKQTNESENIIRGMKQVGAASRAGGTCVIKIKNQGNKSHDGVAGFITGFDKDSETGLLSFLVVGVQNNEGTGRYYVSSYFNIDPKNLNGDNFGVATGDVYTEKKDIERPYEVEVKTWTNASADLALNDGVLECAIGVSAASTGVVTVKLYKQGSYEVKTQSAQMIPDGDPFATVTVQANQTPFADDKAKGKLCCYANIQPEKTLNAEWEIYDATFKYKDESYRAAMDEDYSFGEIDFE